MATLGSFALLLALALSVYSFLAGIIALVFQNKTPSLALQPASGMTRTPRSFDSAGFSSWLRQGSERLGETARRADVATFAAVFLAAFVLVVCAFQDNFSIAYIFHHSNRDLSAPYKFAVLWSGQEGSLLFWSLLLAAYGFVLRLRYKTDPRLFAYASVVLAGVQIFFLLLVNFAANPFGILEGPLRADGSGLNPLLQYPEMVIHPPMLYLGYVGFTVPFAFALGALIMKYPGEKWINITRRWTMVTWAFLTCGVFLGAHWAYSVLGWGGYWGWDPVENASLMPWLTGTAFLHSVMMQEKRGMMKSWNVWLIFSTFMLAILGTLLTRSGLVSSVHAFAQSAIGTWFWVFLVITLAVCLFTYILRRDHLRTEHKLESLVSRESSFLFNNLVLLAACFTVLWGTLFPVLSEYVQGNRVTVSAPFYNRVAVPIGVFLLFLTGIGPLLAWRSTSLKSIRRNFIVPAIVAFVVAIAIIPLGVHPWTIFTTDEEGAFYAWITFTMAAFVATAIFAEFFRGAKVIQGKSGQNLLASMVQLTRRNTRRYGGYIVHFGIVLIFIGIGGQAFHQTHEQTMNYKDSFSLGPYRLVCLDYSEDSNPNYDTTFAILDVYRGDHKVTQLSPEMRIYAVNGQPSTIVANHSTLAWDLYVIYAGKDPQTGQPVIKAFLNPLVAWIWIGLIVTILGTAVALAPNLSAAVAAQRHRVVAPAEPVPAGRAGD